MAKGFVKARMACALAGGALLAANAHAQSSVTLYGVIDEGIDYVNNSGGHSLWRMRDGTYDGVYGSRWGLKGSEDLGGGLSAIFKLEAGFSTENGQSRQGGRLFGRQAYVGLSDARIGTVTLGRQYDSVVDFLQPLSASGQLGGPLIHSGDIDNVDNSFRVDNAVKYASPKIGGLTFGGLYSFTNTNAPGRGTTGLWSVGVNYAFGPLNVAGAYLYAKDPAQLLTDGNFVANTTGAAIGASGPFSYVGNPSNEQVFGAALNYVIGSATVGIDYTNAKFDNANGTNGTVRFDNYEAWGRYYLTPAWYVGAQYVYTHGNIGYSQAIPIYHQVGLTTAYSLSKRTSLYAMSVWQKAAGAASNADIFDGAVGSASTNNHQIMGRVGIYHLF
ncbi:outer membrane porin [Caballeronia arvi]|uniref:Outer membrane porin n=1 Tax=Caballeronia arvi TaxID=1777135 RepID=A0A158KTH8_9BURK|nr:outer membrane porin [Caballeronia arvi]